MKTLSQTPPGIGELAAVKILLVRPAAQKRRRLWVLDRASRQNSFQENNGVALDIHHASQTPHLRFGEWIIWRGVQIQAGNIHLLRVLKVLFDVESAFQLLLCFLPSFDPELDEFSEAELHQADCRWGLRNDPRIISHSWSQSVIPSGQRVVISDAEFGKALRRELESGRIGVPIEVSLHPESSFGFRRTDEVEQRGVAAQWFASPVLADLAEQTVLDGIPFGSAGGVMTDRDREAQAIAKLGL